MEEFLASDIEGEIERCKTELKNLRFERDKVFASMVSLKTRAEFERSQIENNNIEITNYDKQLAEIDKELKAYSETFDEFINIYKTELERSEKVLNMFRQNNDKFINYNVNINNDINDEINDDFKIFKELENL
jgi:chromosome segregation ATPase